MAKHKEHSAAVLSDALEHVVYEIWKYKQSVADYSQIRVVGGDAALEFRILHHRVLLEFFYGPAKHADNIVACEYISTWQSSHNRTNVPWLDEYVKRCHTMLAHISATRVEITKHGLKNWGLEWQKVEPHLDQVITDFFGGLSDDYKKICLQWINCWLRGCGPWSRVLEPLVSGLESPA